MNARDVTIRVLREAADAINALPQDYECDPGRGDAADLLRRMADDAAPRTERSYWQAIADSLNAAEAAGMHVGIDLDGTLTDHQSWSVVWDRQAEQWAVAGYDDEDEPEAPAAPDFFRAGHTYAREHHGRTIEFRVRYIDTPPGSSYQVAFGWRPNEDGGWEPTDSDDLTGWTDITRAEHATARHRRTGGA